jgi:membrane-associated protein
MIELFSVPHLITTYGYLGIALIVFLESGIFFALPGDSLLFTAGILASSTYLRIYWLIPIIFFSTFIGSVVGYHIGIHIEKLRRFSFFSKIIKESHIHKTSVFFDKYGKFTIIFSRFIPIVRTFTPIVAGIAHMQYVSFIKYNFIGSIVWSTSVTLIGYFLGRTFPEITNHLLWLIILVILISILPGIIQMMRKKKI